MSKRCWAISWDHQFRVYAVRLEERRGGRLFMLEHRSNSAGSLALGDRLRLLLNDIQLDEDEFLALGGYMPECVVFERAMPPLPDSELEQALNFELAEALPEPSENCIHTFLRLGTLPDGRARVRIMAVNRARLESLLAEIRDAGVRADILLHPFMAVGPEFDRMEMYMPFVEPDCVFKPAGQSGLREAAMLSGYAQSPALTRLGDLAEKLNLSTGDLPMSGAYPTAVLLGAALLRDSAVRGRGAALLPHDLVRRRFRRYRHNIIYLGGLSLLVISALLVKAWIQERDLVLETAAKVVEVQRELDAVRKERATIDRRQLILRKFCENITPDAEILGFLYRLTSVLPDNMYVTGFACAAGKVSVTIIYAGERIALLDLLGSIPNYKLAEDTKTTQNADNKTSTAQVVWTRTVGAAGGGAAAK